MGQFQYWKGLIVGATDNGDFTTEYQCPTCDYLISKIEFEMARYDYDCPRCGKTKLSEFKKCQK